MNRYRGYGKFHQCSENGEKAVKRFLDMIT